METKPGIYTTEFWITVVVSVVNWTAHASQSGQLPLKWTVGAQGVLAAVYALARGLAKAGVPADGPLTVAVPPDEGDAGTADVPAEPVNG